MVAGGTSPAARADDAGGDDATDATTPVAEKVRRAGRRGSVLGAAVDAVGEGAKKGRARRNSTVGAVPGPSPGDAPSGADRGRRSSITGTDGFGAGAGGRRRSLTGTEMGAAGGTRRKSLTQDDLVALNRPADGADGGGGDSDAEIDDEDDAFTLLERAQARSEFFRGFDDDELRVLADNMAVMPFREGEVIMQKGEPASWVGILLDGKLAAREGRRVLGEQSPGDICGEIALFHGGVRGAEMAGTAPGAVAAIMVNELQQLYRQHPDLCLKLVRMFGQASIQKLDREKAEQVKSTITSRRGKKRWRRSPRSEAARRRGLREMEIGTLCDGMMYHRFAKGDCLMRRGEDAAYVCVLLSGKLSAHVSASATGSLQAMQIVPGELVGEVGFFKKEVRTTDVYGAAMGWSAASRSHYSASLGARTRRSPSR